MYRENEWDCGFGVDAFWFCGGGGGGRLHATFDVHAFFMDIRVAHQVHERALSSTCRGEKPIASAHQVHETAYISLGHPREFEVRVFFTDFRVAEGAQVWILKSTCRLWPTLVMVPSVHRREKCSHGILVRSEQL